MRRRRTLILFKFKLPGEVYANDWYAASMAEARAEIRDWLKIKRLPRGFEIWKA